MFLIWHRRGPLYIVLLLSSFCRSSTYFFVFSCVWPSLASRSRVCFFVFSLVLLCRPACFVAFPVFAYTPLASSIYSCFVFFLYIFFSSVFIPTFSGFSRLYPSFTSSVLLIYRIGISASLRARAQKAGGLAPLGFQGGRPAFSGLEGVLRLRLLSECPGGVGSSARGGL